MPDVKRFKKPHSVEDTRLFVFCSLLIFSLAVFSLITHGRIRRTIYISPSIHHSIFTVSLFYNIESDDERSIVFLRGRTFLITEIRKL